MQTGDRITCQRFSQTVVGWKINFESSNANLIKVAINFVKHLPVPFTYAFTDSPSLIDMDSKESKG